MATVRASRTIAAPARALWEVVADPHHLPRWWPRVTRVEDVDKTAFTEVMSTAKGKLVRADFELLRSDEHELVLRWAQRVQGTPFERVLRSAETELRLTPLAGAADGGTLESQADATLVTLELRQVMNGFFARFGSLMVRRAALATLEQALDGLERIGA